MQHPATFRERGWSRCSWRRQGNAIPSSPTAQHACCCIELASSSANRPRSGPGGAVEVMMAFLQWAPAAKSFMTFHQVKRSVPTLAVLKGEPDAWQQESGRKRGGEGPRGRDEVLPEHTWSHARS